MATTQNKNVTVILTNVRLSFPQVFEPRAAQPTDKPRYGASFLIDKSDKKNLEAVRKAMDEVAKAYWPKGAPKKTEYCLRDAGDKDYAGYEEGNFYVSAARAEKQGRPLVVDRNKAPLTEADQKIYGGCYVNAKISIYAMEHKTGGPMVNAALEVVQFVRDGEPFGGGRTTADDMPDVEENGDDAASMMG